MNWHDLIEDVRIELGLLHQLADEAGDLVGAIRAGRDGPTEHLAAGAVLQSFYGGVEKAMTLIAEQVDDGWDRGDNARAALLDAMGRPTANRAALLSAELADVLRKYMEFREAFRYAQFFHLNWEQTAPLVIDLPRALGVFETRIEAFLTDASGEPAGLTDQATDLPRYWSQPVKVKTVRLEKKPTIIMCIMAMAFGAVTAFTIAKDRYGPWVPQVIPARVIHEMFTVDGQFAPPAFRDPDGRTVELTFHDRKAPFLVTAGRIVENQKQIRLTGRIDRRGPPPADRPAMSLTFHDGLPIFFQAIDADGRFERGGFHNGTLTRFALCQPDGLPVKTYHLTTAGRTACMIERGRYPLAPTGYEGSYYRFYHEGRQVAELFTTDDGLLLKSDVWGLDNDLPAKPPTGGAGDGRSTAP